jgi:hypothetical protein
LFSANAGTQIADNPQTKIARVLNGIITPSALALEFGKSVPKTETGQ